MKPLKLIISAFGPYKDRIEIDFKKLGDNGIFLITGDTGSGKTTIFDALSFALFGEASGSRRENASFRSDFANDDVNTFVELEFVHKNIIYKLSRVPRYMRKKKRGDGVTTVNGDATLIYNDNVITGEKNVTEKCIEILGMNANQFKQIVMIAQGEFLNLLLSKTKDRASIFRHIFDTGIYKNISDMLKDKYLVKRREYEDSTLAIKSYIQGILLETELTGTETTEQVLDLLVKEINNDKKKELSIEEERNTLFKKSSKLIEFISEGKIINDSIANLVKFKEKLDNLLSNINSITEKEDILNKNKSIWEVIVPKNLELIRLKKELTDKKNKLNNNDNEYKNALKNYDDVLLKYNGINDKLDMIQLCNKLVEEAHKKLSLLNEIDKLEKEFDDLNKKLLYCSLIEKSGILAKFDNCKNQEKEITSLRDKISNLKDEYVKANQLYGEHYDMFLSAQAGILASNLKDGQACPVCGSTNHPKLALMVDNILTKEELDNEKIILDDMYGKLEQLRIELNNREKDLDILRINIQDIEENILIKEIDALKGKCLNIHLDVKNDDITKLESESDKLALLITEKRVKLNSEDNYESLNKEINSKKELIINLDNEIKEIKNSYDMALRNKANFQSLCKVLNDDIDSLNKDIANIENDYIKTYQELGYSSEEEYEKIKLDKDKLKILEMEIKKYNDDLTDVKGNINSLKKIINGRDFINLDSYEEELNEINNKLNIVNLSLKDINSKLSNNKKIYDNIKNVSDKTTKLEREVMIYKDLSDTANGTIAGKSKLEFEQYVQASYFDRVLVSANKRLSYMTEDRYQLFRKEEAVKVSDKLGLELEVMDYYTGKRRDIKSLSGGESFKASLCLALGMSDTIQEFSGGVVVDAMFIDEGFGSLDDESLEQAMNAIMMLSQGNKIIGIISHVNELKARIDKKIVVKKSSVGSEVNIVV